MWDKQIAKEYNHTYYLKNREKLLERQRQWYWNNQKRKIEYDRRYAKEHREAQRAASERYRQRNPRMDKIHRLARHSFLMPNCQLCSSTLRLVRHHPDYSKPLEIITLCQSCHRSIHNFKKEAIP